jgi:hypothetical protein
MNEVMSKRWVRGSALGVTALLAGFAMAPGARSDDGGGGKDGDRPVQGSSRSLIAEGRQTFRFATFGDQAFWGDTIKLHQAIEGVNLGGVGAGVSPRAALAAGLKVDVDALPISLQQQLRQGKVNLGDPATTVALLKLNSVVGLTGFFNASGQLDSLGIQCALCHSVVDNSFAPGIGRRLDGWPNRDLNVGAIVALAPDLSVLTNLLGVSDATVRAVLNSWGPGKFDAELLLDGKAFRPDGKTSAVLIPPAFGLAGVNLGTWTGFGSTTYWNAFVANIEMHGQGNFSDSRLADATQFPVAAKAGFNNVRHAVDLITPQLAGLHVYQLAIAAPKPVVSDDQRAQASAAVTAGQTLFNGKAQCATCHVTPLFTEPGFNMHTPAEMGIDSFQADRSPTHMYRTAPLGGLFTHSKGGYYHDGRFATLQDVVNHYDQLLNIGLTAEEERDLISYLNTL